MEGPSDLNPPPGMEAGGTNEKAVEALGAPEEYFEKRFGITKDELGGIEGFDSLSKERKFLVLQNLSQFMLGRVKEQAYGGFKEKMASAGLIKKIGLGITKKSRMVGLEKSALEFHKKGGIGLYGGMLKTLVKAAENGPDAAIGPEGRLEINYATPENIAVILGRELTSAEKEQFSAGLQEFNKKAQQFRNMPREWSYDTAKRGERKEFEKREDEYRLAKADIINLISSASNEQNAFSFLNKVDGQIQLDQFLSSNPEVESELAKIKNKSVLAKVFQDVIVERGGMGAGGYLARMYGTAALGFIGAPIAASAIGGTTAYFRAKETIRQDAMSAREGGAGGKEKVMVRANKGSDEEAEVIMGEVINPEMREITRRKRGFADSAVFQERIGGLLKKIEDPDNQNKDLDLKHLNRLLSLARGKVKDGLVNFGESKVRYSNQYEFFNSIGAAEAVIAANGREIEGVMDERVEKVLDLRKKQISWENKKFVIKQTAKGAALSAGFAAVGALFRHVRELGVGKFWSQVAGEAGEGGVEGTSSRGVGGVADKAVIETTEPYKPLPKDFPMTESPATSMPGEDAGATDKGLSDEEREILFRKGLIGAEERPPSAVYDYKTTAHKGDNVWKITERQLKGGEFAQKFNEFENEGQKTFVIDAIKRKIALDPQKYGLTNIDRIKAGDEVDLTEIFKDRAAMDEIFNRAGALHKSAIDNIENNNRILEDWVREHPGSPLTSERVEDILSPKGATAVETPGGGKIIYEGPPTDGKELAPTIDEAAKPSDLEIVERENQAIIGHIIDSEKEWIEKAAEETRQRLENAKDVFWPNEVAIMESVGMDKEEFMAIQDVTVGKLLEQIPSKNEAWAIWRGEFPDKTINLPHGGHFYDSWEFGKQIRLADYVRSFKPGEQIKKITVKQFLRLIGPRTEL